MKMRALLYSLLIVPTLLFAEVSARLSPVSLTVDGSQREALVYAPATAKTQPAPLIFAWHGHGGNMRTSALSFHFHTLWPGAIVVYPQGLNTPGRLTDPEGKKPGWQGRVGDQNDRDLKFFDALWTQLHQLYKIDDRRVYSSGHSNGGGFTYLLWAARGDRFTAMAPSAAITSFAATTLKPKPVLHLAGEADELVKYAWQQATIQAIRTVNHTAAGRAWELDAHCTIYPSESGTPVITAIHPGGHQYPKEAPAVIIKFFKSQTQKLAAGQQSSGG